MRRVFFSSGVDAAVLKPLSTIRHECCQPPVCRTSSFPRQPKIAVFLFCAMPPAITTAPVFLYDHPPFGTVPTFISDSAFKAGHFFFSSL